MALKGSAFMIMWHDIAAEADAEYNVWHTRQHMPERLDHPGFLRSRRGINRQADHQVYFTLYEGETLDTFLSPEYTHSLNNPTDWTRQVAPHFRNFLRMACSLRQTSGRGMGGGLITARISLGSGEDAASVEHALGPLMLQIGKHSTVTAVHLAGASPAFSDQKTSETELRPKMNESSFDLVLLIETVGLAEAEAEIPNVRAMIASASQGATLVQAYDIAYTLERRETC